MTAPVSFKHQAIAASAGSGKTYQLVNRFLRLVASGVSPDRIAALTFSRAAAGEILDKILRRLADAALDLEKAEALARDLENGTGSADVVGLLRRIIEKLHALRIGTLDSFFVSVVKAFPFELGMSGDFEILDGFSADDAVRSTLRRVLADGGRAAGEGRTAGASRPGTGAVGGRTAAAPSRAGTGSEEPVGKSDLLLEFRLATFGSDEKSLGPKLRTIVEGYHDVFLLAPDRCLWGAPSALWDRPFPWAVHLAADPLALVARLRSSFSQTDLDDRAQAKLDEFLEAAGRFGPGTPLQEPVTTMLEKLIDIMGDLDQGTAALTLYKSIPLDSDACGTLADLTRYIIACVLQAHMERTRGLHAILQRYETEYDRHIRKAGRLAFRDIQLLLSGGRVTGVPRSVRQAAEQGRIYVDYRLDTSFDHWLLDEFQDTSTLQWRAIANLVDEVLQDYSGARSLFYVGDVKQAIHGWRGGDSGLFERILEHYNEHEERILQTSLSCSWRSARPIMDAVNRVFSPGNLSSLSDTVSARWAKHFSEHDTARVGLSGSAAIIQAESAETGMGAKRDARFLYAARLVREIDPICKGLTAAVLLRSNDNGKRMVDTLRSVGVAASWDGRFPVADNPYCEAMLSLLSFAAHPGDSLSYMHLRMTPLRRFVPPRQSGAESLVREVLGDVSLHGFEYFVRKWTERLDAADALDPFASRRSEDLLSAALRFDADGTRDPLDFVEFVRSQEIADVAATNTVHVMTMHRSKGLEFDVVVLPDLNEPSIRSRGALDLEVMRRDDSVERAPKWVLSMPVRAVACADPVLAECVRRIDDDYAYEQLCLLYVAMTRAKRGLYMIVSPIAASSSGQNLALLARNGLAGQGPAATLDAGESGGTLLGAVGNTGWAGAGAETASPSSGSGRRPDPRPPGRGDTRFPSTTAVWCRAWKPHLPSMEAAPAEHGSPSREGCAVLDPPSRLPPPGGSTPSLSRGEEGVAGFALSSPSHLPRLTPSGAESAVLPAPVVFAAASTDAARRGTLVHAMFEQVEWREDADGAAIVASMQPAEHDDVFERAASLFLVAMEMPAVCEALARPFARATLWRERRFDMVLDYQLVSGCFDRVTILLDDDGRPVSACVLDYKTDNVASVAEAAKAAEMYAPQMSLYRRLLARMFSLSAESVTAKLLFIRGPYTIPT